MPPIDRRTFLSTTGAALAGAAASPWIGSNAARAGQFTGKIKKAVKYHMIGGDRSVMDKFKLLADLGFDGTEPRVRDVLGKIETKTLVKASDATGVRIHGVVGAGPDISKAVDLSKALGGSSVLLTLPPDRDGSYAENYKKQQEKVREAIPHAEKQGIKLLIENVWNTFLIAPPLMARFIDELDSDTVGSYCDLGNCLRWGEPHHWVEVLGDRIGKLDVKDYHVPTAMKEGLRAGFSKKIGQGSANWDLVREQLAKIHYTGWATAEVNGGGRERLADIAQRMDHVLDL